MVIFYPTLKSSREVRACPGQMAIPMALGLDPGDFNPCSHRHSFCPLRLQTQETPPAFSPSSPQLTLQSLCIHCLLCLLRLLQDEL